MKIGPGALALAIATLPGLGCNLVVGIEELSGTPADDFAETCIELINEERSAKNVDPIERWVDAEACAANIAKQLSETGSASLGDCDPPSAQLCGPREGTDASIIHACIDGGGDTTSDTREKAACSFYTEADKRRRVVILFK